MFAMGCPGEARTGQNALKKPVCWAFRPNGRRESPVSPFDTEAGCAA
jgi:hypothetical protein